MVEADDGAPQGREVKGGPHTKSSKEQDGYKEREAGVRAGSDTRPGARAGPVKAPGTPLSRRKMTYKKAKVFQEVCRNFFA
ncbi:hypothetical protein ABIA85_009158 [Bradyrhizobium sp. LA6.10]|uniref:hypothetical protein n=1 Tax=Bradyrhizobium sp. LA6.10 TaxID=3156318 RepID=UPI003398538A